MNLPQARVKDRLSRIVSEKCHVHKSIQNTQKTGKITEIHTIQQLLELLKLPFWNAKPLINRRGGGD